MLTYRGLKKLCIFHETMKLTAGFAFAGIVVTCDGFKTPLAISKALIRAAASVAAARLLCDCSQGSSVVLNGSHMVHSIKSTTWLLI
jgi:hypothetical protein